MGRVNCVFFTAGVHTESELVRCTEIYLSKECPPQSLPWILARLLLPTVSKILIFLGILSPFPCNSNSSSSSNSIANANSTSTSPFSLSESPQPSASPVSPVYPVSLPSFVFLPCSQPEVSSRTPAFNSSNFPLQESLPAVKEENVAALQAGIDLRALPEGNRKLLNAWIRKKSAEWKSNNASVVQFTANLLESISFSAVSSVDRSKVVPCFPFSCKTRFQLPAFLSSLLISPSLSIQQLDELDSSSQSLLFFHSFSLDLLESRLFYPLLRSKLDRFRRFLPPIHRENRPHRASV